MIYLYAITEARADAPEGRGLEDVPLQLTRTAEVAGLYSIHERIEARPEPEALWRHQHVVEAAMQAGPTLPVRFGTTFAHPGLLESTLGNERGRLRDQLERVRGCVELAVRVGLASRSEPPPRDGRGYLEARLGRRRRHEAIVRDTLAPLSDLAVRTRSAQTGPDREEVCASYLVLGEGVDDFTQQVKRLADHHPELWLSCTGPWPPYSFVEFEEAA